MVRAKTEEGFVEVSARRDSGLGLLDRKAAFSIALKLIKSEFARSGAMMI